MNTSTANPVAVRRFVWTVSIAIPLVVVALFLILRQKDFLKTPCGKSTGFRGSMRP